MYIYLKMQVFIRELLIVAYIFIALEKIPKVTIALLGAAITIVLGLVSQTKVVNGLINPHYFINFIDLF